MRRILYALPAAAVAAVLALAAPAQAMPLFSSGTHYLCANTGAGDCLTPYNQIGTGYRAQFTASGWRINLNYRGAVSGSAGWPFTSGTGWNTRYDGHSVYMIQWYANTGYCISSVNSSEDYVRSEPCDVGDQSQLFVESGSWLISANATSITYPGGPGTGGPEVLVNHGAPSCNASGWAQTHYPPGGGSCYNDLATTG